MRARRSILTACLGAAGILAVALVAPVQAMASSGFITPVGNPTSPADSPGMLSIGLEASSDITHVTVQIGFGATSYTAPAPLTLTAGTATDGRWTVASPIIEPTDLPLGDYYVYVSATDSGGDSISDVMIPDQWNFNIVPTVTLTASPDAISANGQTVTLSGVVTAVTPDSPQPQSEPFAQQQVSINTTGEYLGSGSYPWTVTTGDDGAFSLSTPTGMSSSTGTDSFTAEIDQTSTVALALSPAVTIQPIAAPVAITAVETPADPLWGQEVTISGTVTVDEDGTWQPLPYPEVEIADSGNNLVDATSNASGQYSAEITGFLDLERSPFKVSVIANTSHPYAGSTIISLVTTGPFYTATVSTAKASIDKYGVVHVSGCVQNTLGPGIGVPASTKVDIQYAPAPAGPWKTLGTLVTSGSACGSNSAGGQFSGKLPGVLVSAYYRAALTRDQTVFLPVTGNALRASITPTRFVSFRATPHRVKRRAKITVSGVLQALTTRWRGYGSQWVDIIYRPPGRKAFRIAYRVRTSATGHFSKTFKDRYGTAVWSADYFGNSTHLVSGAATVRIRVT